MKGAFGKKYCFENKSNFCIKQTVEFKGRHGPSSAKVIISNKKVFRSE